MINKSVIQKQKYFAADFCKSLGKQLISIINQYGGARDVSSFAVAVAVACAFGPGVVILISHALLSLHFVFTRKKISIMRHEMSQITEAAAPHITCL